MSYLLISCLNSNHMKRLRKRKNATHLIQENLLTQKLNDVTELWDTLTSVPVAGHPSDAYDSYMEDYVSGGERRYQDCTHVKTHGAYGVVDPVSGERIHPVLVSQGSAFNVRSSVPCGHIVAAMRRSYGPTYGRPFSKERVEKWLSDRQLPTLIVVDRDPFESSFSIWFLLVDIIQMPHLLLQIFSRKLLTRRDLFGTRTLKQMADDNLLRKFGVEATFRDLQEFIKTLNKFVNYLDEVIRVSGLIFRWHGNVDDVTMLVPDPVDESVKLAPTFGSIVGVSVDCEVESCTFTRTMAYRVRCPEMISWFARLKQFIDLFGVLDPAAVWDVIPFSFVVDWFYPFGEVLRKHFKPRLWAGEIRVLDYCESIKLKYHSVWSAYALDQYAADSGSIDPWVHISSIADELHTVYIRRRFTPDAASFGNQPDKKNIFTISRAVISSALVAQRLPRPGLIGDLFEGLSTLYSDLPPTGDKVAELAHAANMNYARDERERSKRSGAIQTLRKFELGARRSGSNVSGLSRQQQRGLHGQILFWRMSKARRR